MSEYILTCLCLFRMITCTLYEVQLCDIFCYLLVNIMQILWIQLYYKCFSSIYWITLSCCRRHRDLHRKTNRCRDVSNILSPWSLPENCGVGAGRPKIKWGEISAEICQFHRGLTVLCQLAVCLKSLFLWSMCDGVKTWVCAIIMCLAFVHWSDLLFLPSPLNKKKNTHIL